MGTMYLQSDLKSLETGLKDLKQCRLMKIEEFRYMYHAIEKHHRNMRLAHLTGQAPDLQLHGEQDTRFYNILVKMMNEVKLLKTKEQRESLMKVHTWFQSNKHTLHCAPKFGKEHAKKEADEIHKKASGVTRSKSAPKSGKPKTPRAAEKKEEKTEDKPVTTRLTSAEGMRNFFKSATPSTQLNGAETPQGFLNLDLPSHSDKVNEFLTSRFFAAGEFTGMGRHSTLETPVSRANVHDQLPTDRNAAIERFMNSPNFFDGPDMEFQHLGSSLGEVEEGSHCTPVPHFTPRDEVTSVVSQRYVESLTPRSNLDDDPDVDEDLDTAHSQHPEEDGSMPELRRKLSRAQTPSASIRGALSIASQEQSSNLSTYMPKKMIHPIASLVNPHAQLAEIEARQAERDYLASRENSVLSMRATAGSKMQYSASKNRPLTRKSSDLSQRPNTLQSESSRPATVAGHHIGPRAESLSRAESLGRAESLSREENLSRAENLASWKNFNKDMAYGQDILSNLNFVGRSGTAMDVRYSAHDLGENPEEETPLMLALFSQFDNSPPTAKVIPLRQQPTEVQEIYTQNSLEEFYQLTDGYYPPKLPKYHRPVVTKPKSAKSTKSTKSDQVEASPRVTSARTVPLGRDYLNNMEVKKKEETPRREQTDVKLNHVVGMIDSVSNEMGFFKERLAPSPAPGFRQPSSNSVTRRPLSRPATASGQRSPSPIQRSDTPPVIQGDLNANFNTNSVVSQDLLLPSQELDNTRQKPARILSAQTNRTARAVDWRGKISPELKKSLKWQRQKFAKHSFVKKLHPGKRPVGATHAGNRPKTAPMTFREKWKIDKPSDSNIRVESQAATNTMMQVDQRTMDHIMMVQPIEQWNTGGGSMTSIYLDEDFLRSFGSGRHTPGTTLTTTPVPMEYVPIVATAPKGLMESRTQSRQTRKSERTESRLCDPSLESLEQGVQERSPSVTFADEHISKRSTQEISATSQEYLAGTALTETSTGTTPREIPIGLESQEIPYTAEQEQEEFPGGTGEGEKTEEGEEEPSDATDIGTQTDITRLYAQECGQGDHTAAGTYHTDHGIEDILEDTSDACSFEASTTNPNQQIQFFSEDLHNGKVHIEVIAVPSGGRPPTPPQERDGSTSPQLLTKSDTWHFSPLEDNNKERPYLDLRKKTLNPNLYHKGEHWTKAIVKPENYCFHCLPDSMSTKVGRSAGRMPARTQSASAQVLRMARKQSEYFKRAPPVRTPPSIPRPYHQSIHQDTPRQGEVYKAELEHHARKMKSPRHFMEHVVELRKGAIQSAPPGSSFVGDDNLLQASLQVCRLPTRASGFGDEDEEQKQDTDREAGPDYDRQRTLVAENTMDTQRSLSTRGTTLSKQSLAHIGRPIAQVSHIHDPWEEAAAARLQFEAKAAVDIQRIFRGYVARNVYKKLLKEDRERREDQQKAAVEIQRRYRGHLIRKHAIEKKTGLSPDKLQWAKEYKEIQTENAINRQRKMTNLSQTNTENYHKANNKIAVIGPHVEIYQIYHPKQTGPTKQELTAAAVQIQRHIRGFIIRKRFEKLQRKAVWHGSTFPKMVRDYKNILKKCQLRHGVDRPKTPFTIQEFNEYMDMRKRYESVFDKKSFGNELELVELESFFRECDLYPSSTEIEEALDVVLHGQKLKRGLLKSEVLEMVFYIYVPKATGLRNTRQSTWLNPIIDGVEARKLLGSEFVEKAPLEVCAKLVIDSKRQRREKENEEREKKLKEEMTKIKKSARKRSEQDKEED